MYDLTYYQSYEGKRLMTILILMIRTLVMNAFRMAMGIIDFSLYLFRRNAKSDSVLLTIWCPYLGIRVICKSTYKYHPVLQYFKHKTCDWKFRMVRLPHNDFYVYSTFWLRLFTYIRLFDWNCQLLLQNLPVDFLLRYSLSTKFQCAKSLPVYVQLRHLKIYNRDCFGKTVSTM